MNHMEGGLFITAVSILGLGGLVALICYSCAFASRPASAPAVLPIEMPAPPAPPANPDPENVLSHAPIEVQQVHYELPTV